MVSIERKKVVFSTSFLVSNDTEAFIDALVEGTTLRLGITFRSGTSGEQRTGSWESSDGIVHFTFSGWNNPLGTCTLEPTKFGDVGKQRIFFQLAHHYIGDQNLVHLFISVGD